METNNRFKINSSLLKGNTWLKGLFGVEKENIRVDRHGVIAQTLHPAIFGDKLNHLYITTDFSESQVEMITPPLPSVAQTLGFLETIHDIVSLELEGEYLWPQRKGIPRKTCAQIWTKKTGHFGYSFQCFAR